MYSLCIDRPYNRVHHLALCSQLMTAFCFALMILKTAIVDVARDTGLKVEVLVSRSSRNKHLINMLRL